MVQTGLDGPDATVGALGDLLEGQITEIAQDHHHALVDGQRLERLAKRFLFVAALVLVGTGPLWKLGHACPVLPLSQSVMTAVDKDPLEPRLETGRVAQPRPGAPGSNERVLDSILSLGPVAQQDGGQPVAR